MRTYDLIDDAFKALQAGQVDAVINDFPVSKYHERSKKDLVVVQTIETDEQYGLAFEKGSQRLRRRVNATLARMKHDGTYTRIYRKWFEQDPPERYSAGGPAGGLQLFLHHAALVLELQAPLEDRDRLVRAPGEAQRAAEVVEGVGERQVGAAVREAATARCRTGIAAGVVARVHEREALVVEPGR